MHKILQWISSFINQILFLLMYLTKQSSYKSEYTRFPIINENKKALVVFLHGMNANSGQFMYHIPIFENNNKYALYTPEILNKGFESVDKCGQDILDKIITNVVISEEKIDTPIILIGISNGGRIALWLYSHLLKYYNNIYISTLASPINGTYMADILLNTGLYKFSKYDKKVLNELKQESPKSIELLKECSKCDNFYSHIKCYATETDIVVYPSINAIIPNASHKIITGHGHNSIIPKLAREQYEWCEDIINK